MMATMLDEGEASDAELAMRARAGDREAFGRLVERHYGTPADPFIPPAVSRAGRRLA